MDGILVLEDGRYFRGTRFSAPLAHGGEVVFNTSMTGYQEILSDPSYQGQIVTLTTAHVGNYGVNVQDRESLQIRAAGLIVRDYHPAPSSRRSEGSLHDALSAAGVPGLSGVDTRALGARRVSGMSICHIHTPWHNRPMRLPRLDFPGARHHVMNRGARRADIFPDDAARQVFLGVLAELPQRFGVRVHAYALMPNHYHLMLESVSGEISRAMRHVGGEFTRRVNYIHSWDGPIFRGRFHNRLVDTEAYWRHLLAYLHLNPARAGLAEDCGPDWTSHTAYLGETPRPEWLSTDELQQLFGSLGAYMDYYRGVRDGTTAAPADFDAKRLWAPHSTGVVAVPDARRPLWRLADALAAVSAVTGQSPEELTQCPRGTGGNPANWLAAWWLSRHCGIPHGEICAALWASHTTISKRIRLVEERRATDERLRGWVQALGDLANGHT